MDLPLLDRSAPMTFFDLPPELRNWIYELSLFGSEYAEIDIRHSSAVQVCLFSGSGLKTAASLIRASVQVRAEFAPIMYGMQHFCFSNAGIANQWACQIGNMVAYVRDVEVDELHIGFDGLWPSTNMAGMQTWIWTMTKMKDLEKFTLPCVVSTGSLLKELPTARFFSKLLLPLCRRIVQHRRNTRPQTRTAEALQFLEYPVECADGLVLDTLHVGLTTRCMLESKLRTAEEQMEFEEEVLQDIQRLFVSQSDEETEALL